VDFSAVLGPSWSFSDFSGRHPGDVAYHPRMRPLVPLSIALLLACSDDAAPGEPSGLTTGTAGQAGAPTASAGGSSSRAAGETSAGQAGAAAGQGGTDAGQAGQDAGGSDASQGGAAGGNACEPGTVVECPCPGVEPGAKTCLSDGSAFAACECPVVPVADCEPVGQCTDGRALYSCKNDVPPDADACLRRYPGTNFCCGEPTPALCKADKKAGVTRADAVLTTELYYSLPANAEAWLKSKPQPQAASKIEGKVGAFPMTLDSVEVCVGGRCDDGVGGTISCQAGTLTKVGDVSLCCAKGDYVSSGATPKATIGCKAGPATPYLRVKDLSGTCRDLTPVEINGI